MTRFKSIRLAAACVVSLLSVPMLLGLGTKAAKADWVAMWNNLNVPMLAAVRTACPTVGPQGVGVNYGTPQVYLIRPVHPGDGRRPAIVRTRCST